MRSARNKRDGKLEEEKASLQTSSVDTSATDASRCARREVLCWRALEQHLWQFVAAFVPVKRRHGRLGWWAVEPLSSAFHRVLRCPSLCDEQRQEDEELLRIVLEELLRRICGGRGTICQRISKSVSGLASRFINLVRLRVEMSSEE